MVSFPQVSPPKPCTRLYPPPYALHDPPISLHSIPLLHNKTKSYLIYLILKRHTKLPFLNRTQVGLSQPLFHRGMPTYENFYRPENIEAVGSGAEVTSVLPIAGQNFPLHFEVYLGFSCRIKFVVNLLHKFSGIP
jgi:hypothetical protein